MIYHNLLVSQRECLEFGLLVEAPPDGGCVEAEVSTQLGQMPRLTSRRRASEPVFKMGAPACSCGTNTCVCMCTHRYMCTHRHMNTHAHRYTHAHEYTHMHMCTYMHMCTHMNT